MRAKRSLWVAVAIAAGIGLGMMMWFELGARSYRGDGTFRGSYSSLFGFGYSLDFTRFPLDKELHVSYQLGSLPVVGDRDPSIVISVDNDSSVELTNRQADAQLEAQFTIEIKERHGDAVLKRWAGILGSCSHEGAHQPLSNEERWRIGNLEFFRLFGALKLDPAIVYTMKVDYSPIRNTKGMNGSISIINPAR